MRLIIIGILLVTLAVPAYSADSNARRGWDMVHITGSALGTAYLNHFGLEWYEAALIMFAAGILWELADEAAYQLNWKQNIFDYHRGGDHTDLIRNGIGICLSFPLRRR